MDNSLSFGKENIDEDSSESDNLNNSKSNILENFKQ